jgi:hypothetical protein
MFHQVDFRVPNNAAGQVFIDQLRYYLNRDKWKSVRARTRGPRPPGDNEQCPREDATGFAIYLQESEAVKEHETKHARGRLASEDRLRARMQAEVARSTSTESKLMTDIIKLEEGIVDHITMMAYQRKAIKVLGGATIILGSLVVGLALFLMFA